MLLKFASVLAIIAIAVTYLVERKQIVVDSPNSELKGTILVKGLDPSSKLKGFVSNGRASEWSPYQRTRRTNNALQVSFTPSASPTTSVDLKNINSPSFSKPLIRDHFGAMLGVGSTSSDLSDGSSNYQTLSPTELRSTNLASGQSRIWKYDSTSKAFTAHYVNSDETEINASIGLWHDPMSNSEIFILTGDKEKFMNDYGPTIWVKFEFQLA